MVLSWQRTECHCLDQTPMQITEGIRKGLQQGYNHDS